MVCWPWGTCRCSNPQASAWCQFSFRLLTKALQLGAAEATRLILCNREWACFRGGDAPVYSEKIMTRDQIQTAIKEGIPFLIRMADGEKYEVSEPYRIALGRSYVIVVGKDDLPHILPLLTMTGISYLKPKK